MGKKQDLLGMRFGKLTVIAEAPRRGKHIYWQCLCDCGTLREVCASNLTSGLSTACGCVRSTVEDLTGRTFGRLVALERAPNKGQYAAWLCLCSCGNSKVIEASSLKRGLTASCGCIQSEMCGPNSPFYNHNITDEERAKSRERGRNYPEYHKWRQAVYERDNFTCQCCGKRSGDHNVHHLESYAENLEIRLDTDNGVTLCVACHKSFHKLYGGKNQTYTWQFLEFLQTPIVAEQDELSEAA